MSVTQTIEIQIEKGEGKYIEWSAEVTFDIWREKYGEDADGNRWEWRTYYEVEKIDKFRKDGKKISYKKVPRDIIIKFHDSEPIWDLLDVPDDRERE